MFSTPKWTTPPGTDATINNAGAARVQNQNIPGDGKYDNDQISDITDLFIGRVDLSNYTAFGGDMTETELIRRYLNKNHNCATKS